MSNVKLGMGLLVAGVLVLFLVQNTEVVEVRFMFWSVAMSRALMIFFVFAMGIVTGWLLRAHAAGRGPAKLPPENRPQDGEEVNPF